MFQGSMFLEHSGAENPLTPKQDDVPSDRIDFSKPLDMSDPEFRATLHRMKTKHAEFEARMKFWPTMRASRRAVAYSTLFSFACIMEGYALVMVTGFFSVPSIKRDFGCVGDLDNIDTCEIAVSWQTGITFAIYAGQLVGLYFNGHLIESIGYRRTLLVASVLTAAFIFVTVFAASWPAFLVGVFLCGIPFGVYQTLAANYASDVCPTPIRGTVTSSLGLCWIVGQVAGSVVQYLCLHISSHWAYTIPLALGWVWLIPIFSGVWQTAESPWWLVRRGDYSSAKKALSKLGTKSWDGYNIDNHLAYVIWTNLEEESRSISGGKMGYMECFRGVDGRRTRIACLIWSIQNATGAVLLSFSSYFFRQAGLPLTMSFQFTIVQYGSAIFANCGGWWLMKSFRRRTIHIGGLIGIFFCLLVIGILGLLEKNRVIRSQNAGYSVGAFLLVMSFIFSGTLSLITYPIVTEIPSTRLKAKTVNLARSAYVVVGMANAGAQPQLLNSHAGNLGATSGFIFAFITLLSIFYSYFKLPETKDLNFDVIDKLFEEKVTARKSRKKSEGMIGSVVGGFSS